ncbi:MAG: hypothetical protein FWC57_02825 [Endomicrobia bacterium]|nr:hypothetical protein [Endomicrobiia bacterium]
MKRAVQIAVILIACLSLSSCKYDELKKENDALKAKIEALEQENTKLKETAENYWQNAVNSLSKQDYEQAKNIFSQIIDKFPASELAQKSKDKIGEIDAMLKQKRADADKAIKSLPTNLAKAASATDAEAILDEMERKFDFPDVKEIVSQKRGELQEKIQREKDMSEALNVLGIKITNIRTYWTVDHNVLGGEQLVVPYVRMRIENVGANPITRLSVKAAFELTGKKEAFGEGMSYVIGYGDTPLKPGYSKEVFFGSQTGYKANYHIIYNLPKVSADLYVSVEGRENRLVKTIVIKNEYLD